jgi:hypothetical protein
VDGVKNTPESEHRCLGECEKRPSLHCFCDRSCNQSSVAPSRSLRLGAVFRDADRRRFEDLNSIPNSASPRAADRETADQLCTDLQDLSSSTKIRWCLVSLGDQPYLREEITIRADKQPLPISDVQMFYFHDVAANVVGKVPGSSIVSGNFYLGLEHPLSYSTTENG